MAMFNSFLYVYQRVGLMNSDIWLETGEGPKSIAPSLPAGPAGRELPWNINSWLFPKQRCPGAQAMRISLKDTWQRRTRGYSISLSNHTSSTRFRCRFLEPLRYQGTELAWRAPNAPVCLLKNVRKNQQTVSNFSTQCQCCWKVLPAWF